MRCNSLRIVGCLAIGLSMQVADSWCGVATAGELTVSADFEGGSVRDVEIDQGSRSLSFMPGGDPTRGWPCWWHFRIDGVAEGETITLRLRGSTATVPRAGGAPAKPLASVWAMPARATWSVDGKEWRHTAKGTKDGEWMVYTVAPGAASMWVAWGPPYTSRTALEFVKTMSERSPHAKVRELCRSRGDRPVPMLHVMEGDLPTERRFGVWVQARQHAWECGSSWVAQGFGEWLLRDDPEAVWLRQHAEVFLIPLMDVDNAATGNGGKDAHPQDHNRDWSPEPHWNEVLAAKRGVTDLVDQGRMDVFLDLHNPGPDDPTFFYILEPALLKEPMIGLRDRFIDLAYARISRIKPLIPMSNKPKATGAGYHPLWRQISANWVSLHGNPHTVSLCLETIWNSPSSTTTGYRAVGANLAAATREYLAERPAKP